MFCQRDCDEDAYCYGCKEHVCEECEAGFSIAAAGMGSHEPQAHREEYDDHELDG